MSSRGPEVALTPLPGPTQAGKGHCARPHMLTQARMPVLPGWARGLGLHGKHSSSEEEITNCSHQPGAACNPAGKGREEVLPLWGQEEPAEGRSGSPRPAPS